jgi:hypothetical protein
MPGAGAEAADCSAQQVERPGPKPCRRCSDGGGRAGIRRGGGLGSGGEGRHVCGVSDGCWTRSRGSAAAVWHTARGIWGCGGGDARASGIALGCVETSQVRHSLHRSWNQRVWRHRVALLSTLPQPEGPQAKGGGVYCGGQRPRGEASAQQRGGGHKGRRRSGVSRKWGAAARPPLPPRQQPRAPRADGGTASACVPRRSRARSRTAPV